MPHVKSVREPDAGNLQVRFDERRGGNGLRARTRREGERKQTLAVGAAYPEQHRASRPPLHGARPGRSPRAPALTTRPASDGARLDAHREPQHHEARVRRARPGRAPRGPRAHHAARVDVPAWTRTTRPQRSPRAARRHGPRCAASARIPALWRAASVPFRAPAGAQRRRESLPTRTASEFCRASAGARRPCPFVRPVARGIGANPPPPGARHRREFTRPRGVRALSAALWRAASVPFRLPFGARRPCPFGCPLARGIDRREVPALGCAALARSHPPAR
jgi:hypothetical protein